MFPNHRADSRRASFADCRVCNQNGSYTCGTPYHWMSRTPDQKQPKGPEVVGSGTPTHPDPSTLSVQRVPPSVLSSTPHTVTPLRELVCWPN